MNHFTLCADDYGFNQAVSEGIAELLLKQKINATSCMTNMPYWPDAAKNIPSFQAAAQIGLHFNLTDGKPLTNLPGHYFGSLKTLLLLSHLRVFEKKLIEQEFSAQLDAFIEQTGKQPDFIDGHQHVHQLPIIRDAILNVYQKRFPDKRVWIRVSCNSFWQSLKSFKGLIISLSGALSLRNKLNKLKIPYNHSFSGIYNFKHAENYAEFFTKFLSETKEGGLIMCHPGKASTDPSDEIATARTHEFRYFSEN